MRKFFNKKEAQDQGSLSETENDNRRTTDFYSDDGFSKARSHTSIDIADDETDCEPYHRYARTKSHESVVVTEEEGIHDGAGNEIATGSDKKSGSETDLGSRSSQQDEGSYGKNEKPDGENKEKGLIKKARGMIPRGKSKERPTVVIKRLPELEIVDVKRRDTEGNTLLHYAAKYCDLASIKELVGRGADVDAEGWHKMTPMHFLARNRLENEGEIKNAWECMEFLLDNSKNVNAKDRHGQTVLHHAVRVGNITLVKHLVEWKSKYFRKNIDEDATDKQGNTIFHLAAQSGHKEFFEEWKKKTHGIFPFDHKTWEEKMIEKSNDFGRNPLHFAAENGHLECVTAILKKNKRLIIEEDTDNRTPFQLAVMKGHVDVAKELLKHAKDKDKLMSKVDVNEDTILHYCVRHSQTSPSDEASSDAMLKYLLKELKKKEPQPVKVKTTSNAGSKTKTEQGKSEGKRDQKRIDKKEENVEEDQSTKPQQESEDQTTRIPASSAETTGHEGRNQSSEEHKEHGQENPLLYHLSSFLDYIPNGKMTQAEKNTTSTQWSKMPVLRTLGSKEGSQEEMGKLTVNSEGRYGKTPAFFAAEYNKPKALKLLLEHGADPLIKSSEDTSPLMIAIQNGHKEIVDILLKEGKREMFQQLNKLKQNIFHLAALRSETQWEGEETMLQKLVDHFHKHDQLYHARNLLSQKDCKGNNPFHFVFKKGILFEKLIKLMMIDEGTLRDIVAGQLNMDGDSPLHLAVKYGQRKILENEMIFPGKEDNEDIEDIEDNEGNGLLHVASMGDHSEMVKFLLKKENPRLYNVHFWTPLSCAASAGNLESVGLILNVYPDLLNKEDNLGNTPLHMAAKKGHLAVVKTLIQEGAEIKENKEGKNFLSSAILKNQREVVSWVLETSHDNQTDDSISCETFMTAMRSGYLEGDHLQTPLRLLIKHIPDMASTVLDRCVSEGNEEKSINLEFVEDTYNFRINEKKRIIHHTQEGSEKYSKPYSDRITLKNNHPLVVMINESRKELLKHPVSMALINKKWSLFRFRRFILQTLCFTVFLCFFTGWIMNMPAQTYYERQARELKDACKDDNSTCPTCQDVYVIKENMILYEFFRTAIVFFLIIRGCLAVIPFYEVVLVYSLLRSLLKFEKKIERLLSVLPILGEWMIYGLVVYILLKNGLNTTGYNCTLELSNGTQATFEKTVELFEGDLYEVAAFTAIMSWCFALIYVRMLPKVGKYVLMWFDVILTFLQVMFVYSFLVIGFGLGFYMLFRHMKAFGEPQYSLLKTLVMVTGEFEFENIFFDDVSGVLYYKNLSFTVFTVFTIAMSLVLVNLLVGISVDDIKHSMENASLKRLRMVVIYMLEYENVHIAVVGYFPKWLGKLIGRVDMKIKDNIPLNSNKKFNGSGLHAVSKKKIWGEILHKELEQIRNKDFLKQKNSSDEIKSQIDEIRSILLKENKVAMKRLKQKKD